MPRNELIQFRGGTAAQWTTANPILAAKEPGLETDTGKVKYGDGVTVWSSLPYSSGTQADWSASSGPAQILNKPTLGTAAAQNTSAFATAAQGAKADTAYQAPAVIAAGVDAAAARTAIGAGTSDLAIGTTAGTACAGNDGRLSDARTPTAHTHGVADLTATGTRDATTYLRGDNTWASPAGGGGSGDVIGQPSSVDGEVALFSGTDGKAIKRATGSGLAKLTSGVLGTASAGTDYAVPAKSAPSFVVDTFYGGTIGAGDDQVCIQNTLNAARDAGGGVVTLPTRTGYRWKASQLTIPVGVHFRGASWDAWESFQSTEGQTLQQLTGVNDDFLIFTNSGGWTHPFGISDLVLRGAQGATAGCGINFVDSADAVVGMQDRCTLERIGLMNFAGSGIKIRKGVPITISDIDSRFNGGYGVEIDDAGASVYQVVLRNISGDGNFGYVADAGGAVVLLKGIGSPLSAVTIIGLKSEYAPWVFGNTPVDANAMGGLNALVIDSCSCPVSVIGVQHIAKGEKDRKPGHAIRIKGASRPSLFWQSVAIRDNVGGQTVGADPFLVYDETTATGTDSPHGVWGATDLAVEGLAIRNAGTLRSTGANKLDFVTGTGAANANLQRITGNMSTASGTNRGLQIASTIEQSATAGYTGLEVAITESSVGSGAKKLIDGIVGGATKFAVNNDGSVEVGHGSDTTVTRSAAGRIAVEGAEVAHTADIAPEYLVSGESTMDRRVTLSNVPATAGRLVLTYFTARKAETITQVRTCTSGTAAVGSTLCRIGVYSVDGSGNLTLVASTTSDTALWSASNTRYTKAFAASFAKARGVRYAVGLLCVGATTAPTVMGNNFLIGDEMAEAPRLSGFLNGQTDLPSSITAGSVSNTTSQAYAALAP